VHDLAEAITGDIPATRQGKNGGKSAAERAAMATIAAPLPEAMRAEVLALWEEYEAGSTREGRLAKGLDKLETILQHAQGKNAPGFDLAFNLDYGRAATSADPLLARIRALADEATRQRLGELSPEGTA
jgi:putative hydrolase of HD superfamily